MFPRACYLGFTGTPLMKEQKNNFVRFGGLIDAYSIDQAVRDNAVVPLLYEARHVEMEQSDAHAARSFSPPGHCPGQSSL